MYYVYAHIRPDTGEIFYLGKGKNKRAYSKHRKNKQWHNIVNKNNGEFEVRILNWFFDEETAYASEEWLIACYRASGNLINITDGGEGQRGENHSSKRPEMRELTRLQMLGDKNPMKDPKVAEKAAISNRGQKRAPEICKRYQGENNPMYGRTLSKEHLKILSETHKNKPKSYPHRSKTSTKVRGPKNGMYGRSGPLNPMYGKVSAMKGRRNPMAAFANYIRNVNYWGA